mmetsp:Transcript_56181/g.162806  ORF Transcript_56181/g.162806 Transcript_56181/m.162806 type:complete len:388 (-) Transcript_56181:127-1290(-)
MPLKKKRKAAVQSDEVASVVPAPAMTTKKRRKAATQAAAAAEATPAEAKKQRRRDRAAAGEAMSAPAPATPEPAAAAEASSEAALAEMKKRRRKDRSAAGEATSAPAPEPTPARAPTKRGGKRKGRAAANAAASPGGEVAAEAAPKKKGARKALEPAGESSAPEKVAHTIFVDGVPYSWEVVKIRELFGRCGEVLEVRAPTWQDSGRLRGYAHVDFATPAARDEALKMDGIKVAAKGRFLKIESAKSPSGSSPAPSATDLAGKRRLFVKNIPYDATESELKDLFAKSGPVVDIRVPTSFGRCKGFAYVEFGKADSLAKVVKTGAELRGRKLLLDADTGRGPKAGFHYRPSAFEVGQAVTKGRGRGGGRGGDGGRGSNDGRGRGRGGH